MTLNPASEALREALARIVRDLGAGEVEIVLERPREDGHGDLASNVALRLAKPLGRKPRDLADDILARMETAGGIIERAEVAGPGFINFWLAVGSVTDILPTILNAGADYGRGDQGAGRRFNVEFVSANPTGPLHVGHGRGAALGDAIASLLEATGHEVTREFYVNDAGVQIDRLVQSVWARIQQAAGRDHPVLEGGYHGEYLVELATQLIADDPGLAARSYDDVRGTLRDIAVRAQRTEQEQDLRDFGVVFDVYSSETALYEGDRISGALQTLEQRGVLYEQDGALWLRTTDFGDAKDRVLRKSDGTYTYFTPDIAYHWGKAERGFQRAIDIWGADHHGYVARMRAAMIALGQTEDFFEAVLVQLVKVLRDGEEVRFSKRAGDYVSLRDLFFQAGVDASRYFFLMRRGDAQFVFDIDLATRQSDENPVYYVQYAHTRIAGIFRNADRDPASIRVDGVDLSCLAAKDEIGLMKTLAEYPTIVATAAEQLEPHRIISYVEDLAREVNGWYHRHRVIGEDPALMEARLVLARAAQIVLSNALGLLGISAPERM